MSPIREFRKYQLEIRDLGLNRMNDVAVFYEMDDLFDVPVHDAILFEMGDMQTDQSVGGGGSFAGIQGMEIDALRCGQKFDSDDLLHVF